MKTKVVEELLGMSKTTLFQRVKNHNLEIPKPHQDKIFLNGGILLNLALMKNMAILIT